MRKISNKPLNAVLMMATVGTMAISCGGQPTSDGQSERVGNVKSALGAPCGDGTASTVGADSLCTYTTLGAHTGANGFTPPAGVTSVRVLVVAGGGGGGEGGGGGGGVLTDAAYAVVPGTAVSVTVGDGGSSNTFNGGGVTGPGLNGEDSVFGTIIAKGGGGGGGYPLVGNVGGSGGGSGCDYTGVPASGIAGQGNSGGKTSVNAYGGSGGGGGAGTPGADGGPTAAQPGQNPTIGGNGGNGRASDITGVTKFYGGGGGGGVNSNSTPSLSDGLGGLGGGGVGSRVPTQGTTANDPLYAGTPNTGGGGGGGDCEGTGGHGGSGIVIVRYTVQCFADADCSGGKWCDTGATPHACMDKLANGAALPAVAGHTPALDGTCSAAAAAVVCASGSCDTDDKCGKNNGNGPCAADADCRSGICELGGNGGAGVCRECSPVNVTNCTPTKPICDTTTFACVACNGDNGTTASAACPAANPYCPGGGAACGTCGAANGTVTCTAAGATHAGGICSATGACTDSCNADAQCDAAQWCDTATSNCVADLANGTVIPTVAGHTPALDGKCTAAVGSAICAAGVCDTTDDKCGLSDGAGPCTTDNAATVCRTGSCNAGKCGAAAGTCATDAECGTAKFCDTAAAPAACVDKKASGGACTKASECTSGSCTSSKCDATCSAATDCASGTYCDVNANPKLCKATKSDGNPCDAAIECTSNQCNGGKCGAASATPTPTTTATTPAPTPTATGSAGTSSGGVTPAATTPPPAEDSGCAMAPSRSTRGGGLALAMLAALGLVARVRRRRAL